MPIPLAQARFIPLKANAPTFHPLSRRHGMMASEAPEPAATEDPVATMTPQQAQQILSIFAVSD
jgi:hypothetical protein